MTDAQKKPARKKSAAQHLWFWHWFMAFCYLLLFIGGRYMAPLPKSFVYRENIYDFHKLLGFTVMCLLLVRIGYLLQVLRHKYKRRQPKRKGDWLQTVALHTSLYFFMLLVPLSGYYNSNTAGFNVRVFNTGIVFPHIFPTNKSLHHFGQSVHFWIAYTFLAFIIIHMIDQQKYLRAQLRRLSKTMMRIISPELNAK